MKEVVLDIRTPEEYARGHLQGAILVPTQYPPLDETQRIRLRENLRRAMEWFAKDSKVYVYCKKGARSDIAAEILESMGYDATSLGGVEDGWLAEQLHARTLRLTLT